jgi:hypothetical protein
MMIGLQLLLPSGLRNVSGLTGPVKSKLTRILSENIALPLSKSVLLSEAVLNIGALARIGAALT